MLEEIVATVMVFGAGMVAFIAFSPIGRAIADRIRGTTVVAAPDPELIAEVDQLRHDVMELQERVEQVYYRNVHKDSCVELTYFVHYGNIGAYAPGAVTEFDRTALYQQLDEIPASLILRE